MTGQTLETLGRKQRDRLAYIEFRLWFLGDGNRRDLMDRFDIAPAVATRDFTAYRELAPHNIDFDGSRKIYIPSERFEPIFEHVPERVLTAISRGFGEGEDRQGECYLPCELPIRLNRPSLAELAVVTRAIHQRQVLRVRYHSLKQGSTEREVVPHALVDSGLRWHTRVYDRKTHEFRDLVISRIEAATALPQSRISPTECADADDEWNRIMDLTLVVHPGVERPVIVERDFGMERGALHIKVRAAVAGYVLQQWSVDCSPERRLDPTVHRLCIKDPESIRGVISAVIAPGALGV